MPTHKLIPYWMELRESQNPGPSWDLEEIIYSPAMFDRVSIIDIFERFSGDFLGDNPGNTEILRDQQKTFTLDGFHRENRTLQGVMDVGKWGEGANHFNVSNEERERGARSPADAVEIPYFFLLHLPDRNTQRAIFILHKPGNSGAKRPFETTLKDWMHDDIYLEFNPIMSDNLLEQIQDADRLLKLKLKKDRVAEAPHQRLGGLFEDERDVKQVVEFSANQGQNLPLNREDPIERIRSFLGSSNNTSPATTTIIEEEFSEAKLSIEEDGSTRTFSIDDDEVNMQQVLDREDDNLSTDSQGHPTPESMSPVTIEFANDILRRHQEPEINEGVELPNGAI